MSWHNKHKPTHKLVSLNKTEPAPEQADREPVNSASTGDRLSGDEPDLAELAFWDTTPPQSEKASLPMMKNDDMFSAFKTDILDLFTKSGAMCAKGFEDISRHVFELIQSSIEVNFATTKAALDVKTIKELMDLQSDWLRHSVGTTLSDATKLSDLLLKIAKQAAEPVQTHFATAFGRMVKAA